MDGEAPAKPGEQKVANRRAGWKMHVILALCLLQAANALKGPRLVSGKAGGTVTIQCHYNPSSINRHQRKYWCRLSPLMWLCHTIVSTNHYTHLRYRGRVAIADFPHSGLFVVKLSQLSSDDAGSYRCGIGNRNEVLYSSMNLAVSAGPPSPSTSPSASPSASLSPSASTSPRATSAAGEVVRGSFGTISPAANRWTPGATQTTERQGTGWDRVVLIPGTSRRTASTKGMQTPGTPGGVAARTISHVDSPIWATILISESPAPTITGVSDTTERAWLWGTGSSRTNRARASKEGREATTEAARPREEAERVRTPLDADWTITGTIRPSTLASEKGVWESRQEARSISKPQALGSIEGTTRAAAVWTLGPTSTERSSAEGNTEGELDIPAGESGPQTTPSQDSVARLLRPPGKGPSMKSASPKEENISLILTPLSTTLFPLTLVTLVLLQRKLRRKRTSQEIKKAARVTLIQMTHFLKLQPDQLPLVERKTLQDDSPPAHAAMTVPERDPGP
uniref:Fc of IgA and IgM receptor n=1 Tax=Molossus molossus TaxID=27622 RepID=A0A7J8CQI9_MOLMO|nr:Fc fragment of IgA and IgM receptor [Molossus molossus]